MTGYNIKITDEIIKEHNLKKDEYELILKILNRTPTIVELGIFSAMWSEHCSYKHSKPVLKKLPTKGKYILQGPGENAGIIHATKNLGIAFKIESHNHPSAVEPFQGAATGVGGILRDVFTMGARPIAVLDSLRFGNPESKNTQRLLPSVVKGIAFYGNCVGIPTVGGETVFEDCYETNCLVNVMTIGTVEKKKIKKGIAKGIGNPVIYIGAATGRDGIHGASFASAELTAENQERRSSVQVADPFMEKLLLEATLELNDKGLIVGIQDMGAAGLTSSSVEMANRGKVGIELNIDKVPKRETGMNAYEVMLSESQERMLMITEKGKEKKVEKVLKKWGLHAVTIGKVIKKPYIIVKEKGKVVAEIPVAPLADSNHKFFPLKRQKGIKPKYLENINIDYNLIPIPNNIEDILIKLIGSPNIACKSEIWQQYDHMVRTNTWTLPGSDSAVIKIKGENLLIATSVDGNGRYTYLDPYRGGAIAVAEAARNVSVSGATPVALTNCLNFGNPEDPEIFYQFEKAIEGMADAAKILKTPVTGGNVSFYNEGKDGAIYPTPIVGMVGFIKGTRYVKQYFKDSEDVILLLGQTKDELGASEYLKEIHGLIKGPVPEIDLKLESQIQKTIRNGIKAGIIKSAHDISKGGLAVALAECCITAKLHGEKNIGAFIEIQSDIRIDSLLFGETQSRIIITTSKKDLNTMKKIAAQNKVVLTEIGKTGGDRLIINIDWAAKKCSQKINIKITDLENIWMNGVNKYV
ncbi:MAG: phosphoribosylformylglycinamidine synthase subunit PurL [Candidatus Goldbacteria bacterium]|nr:phosphoribosylformylglycinamidine synthase subunit PurL [Candidatus Goldiibacteriota bacterium]